MSAQWLGFIPDSAALQMRARRDLSEIVAINATVHIRRQNWNDLKASLQATVDRHPDLLSIGVRSDMGTLRTDTGHHAEIWPQDISPDIVFDGKLNVHESVDDSESEVVTATVPIMLNHRPWGRVEYCYRRVAKTYVGGVLINPMVRLLSYFVVFGIVAYTIFVARVMGVFSSTQVVPDRVRQALDTLAEGLLVLDETGKIVLANKAFTTIVGLSAEELERRPASDLAWVGESNDDALPWTMAMLNGELQSERMLRYTFDSDSERILSVNAAPLGKGKSGRGVLATFRDVTHVEEHRLELERMLDLLERSRDEITRKNDELNILATQDSLTGCLNRRAFFEIFDGMWSEAKQDAKSLSCIMIDVDHFKSVNDTYGHHTGDEVLRAVSAAVREMFSSNGLVCRYGGEEFCIVLPGYDVEAAFAQAEKARGAIGQIRLDDPAELRLTASLGVSELRFEAKDTQDLINQADACLYVAKREGRNRSIVFNKSMIVTDESAENAAAEALAVANSERVEIPYKAVTALMSALSFRDTKTAEHSRRVADLCARASEGLMNPSERYVLEVAGLLHDIGKIGVPDEILFKPGPLTPEEWEVMGRHDNIGVDIVFGAFDCPPLTAIMANHHAFYNGAGRERDLPSGENIPVGARLLSIADTYDAIVSDRPYRKGKSHEEAIAEIRRCAGTQFDPTLVEHFVSKIEAAIPTLATGAIAIQKFAAIKIGAQIEKLANAIDQQDAAQINHLFNDIRVLAENSGLVSIAEATPASSDESDETKITRELLRDARDLVDTCRSAQIDFLRKSFEHQNEAEADA
ncbi:diguanylate cyclase [Rubripirellula amarantea]|nr:diguanylate cyclase [Rubripirellula amarantea]